MARSFSIEVINERETAEGLRRRDTQLQVDLRVASAEVASLIQTNLQLNAPNPRNRGRRHEVKGQGVFARPSGHTRRFRGDVTSHVFEVTAGLRSESVAAYVEFGTGIYTRPERRGPHVGYTVRPNPPNTRLGPWIGRAGLAREGKKIYAPSVFIEGTHAAPWIHEAFALVRPVINDLYREAVRSAMA